MIGIYKITNPNGKVYIGQSIDIERRFNHYKLLKCKEQPRLYKSLLKYGIEEHRFEIIWQCNKCYLNRWERYFQEMHNSTGKNGLNCILVKTDDFSGGHSEESKKKISKALKGRKLTTKHKSNIANGNSKRLITDEHRKNLGNGNRGRTFTKEWVDKLREAQIGKFKSKETKDKISQSLKGRTFSEEHKQKLKARIITDEWRLKLSIAAKNRKNKNN
jgi:group I intron endonuclease